MTRPGPLMFRTRRSRFPGPGAASLFALLPALLAAVPAAANVGRTTAVVQQARGTPPRQTTRVLVPKLDLFENERIQTDDRGVTQILFRDGTHLTVGPNSDLVIDRFVYDPDTSAGELAAELGRGVLRFVGGQISKRGRAAITTPVAVIGVRGGIAVMEHDEAGGTNAVLLFGSEMTIEGLGPRAETRRVTRPGFSVTVGSDGAVSNPERLPADRLESVLASLEGSEESDGGAPTRPTPDAVSRSEYAAAPASDPGGDTTFDLAPAGEEVAETLVADNPPTLSHEDPSPALWRYQVGTANIDFGLPFLDSIPSSVYNLTILKREGSFDEVMRTGGYPFLRVRTQFRGQGANQVGAHPHLSGPGHSQTAEGLPARFLGRSVSSARDATTSDTQGAYLIWGIFDERPGRASHATVRRHGSACGIPHRLRRAFDSSGRHHPEFLQSEAHLDPVYFTSEADVQWVLDEVATFEEAGPRGDRNWQGLRDGPVRGAHLQRRRARVRRNLQPAKPGRLPPGRHLCRRRGDRPTGRRLSGSARSPQDHEGDQGDPDERSRQLPGD